jgi:hypothetical protein
MSAAFGSGGADASVGRRLRQAAAAHEEPTLAAIVDELVDRAPTVTDVQWHRLEVFAARRRRAQGLPVEPELAEAERRTAVAALSAPTLLDRIHRTLDRPVLLLKGCEVAAHYPDPMLRGFTDLDLVVDDPGSAQRILIEAGFVEARHPDLFVEAHHEQTLALARFPLLVELHRTAKWPLGLRPPDGRELLGLAVPSATGIDGVVTLPRPHHAVLLAAHSWAHVPLRRIRDFVDIAYLTEGVDRRELEEVAHAWRLDRIWRTTIGTVDALLAGHPRTSAQRIWARNLESARQQRVLEVQVEKLLSPFWALPPWPATQVATRTLVTAVTPNPDERWGQSLRRNLLTVRNRRESRMAHGEKLTATPHLRRQRRTRR